MLREVSLNIVLAISFISLAVRKVFVIITKGIGMHVIMHPSSIKDDEARIIKGTL